MRFKNFICGFAVIYPVVLFGFVHVSASEQQSSLVDPNLKDTQQFLKGELLINNPALNHLPNVGPNYLAQATTFVGEPIVVQDEIKVLGKAPDTASDKIDILPKITVSKQPDQFTVSILKEFSLGYVPGNKGSSHQHHVHHGESNNGESHHYESHGPSEYTSHSYGAPEEISGSINSESFNPSPPIQDFIDQSSYSSSQHSNDGLQQNDNSYYNTGDSSQQIQSEGGYDNQEQSNGGYDGGQSDLSGGYDGGSQQQISGGYDQGGQSGGFSLGQAQKQISAGGYDLGGQQQQQINGGYDQGEVQQQQSVGGYDQGQILQQQSVGGYDQGQILQQQSVGGYDQGQTLQQQSVGGYDQGQNLQQQPVGGYNQGQILQQQPVGGYDQGQILQQQPVGGYDQGQILQQQPVGGYDQGQIQQPQLTGGYNLQEPLQLQQPIGGYDQAPAQQQQQIQASASGYNQPQQQQEQQSNNGGYSQQESVQQQSIGGYSQQQTINVGGYDQASSQQNQQQNNGGYDQGQQNQQQQSNGGYNNQNNNDQGSSYQQNNALPQGNKPEITAQAIHNNVGKSQEQFIKSLGLDSIIQQANLVFKSEQLLNRPNAEQDTVQNPVPNNNNGNDNSGQYGAPANQAQTDAQNPNNQYGAPAQNVNNQYGAPAQNVNNQYGAPAQNVNNQYGAPAQNVNNQYGAPAQNANNQYGAPAQNANNQYGAPSQNNANAKQHQSGAITPAVMDGWIPMRPVFSRTHYTKGGNKGSDNNIWNSKLAAVATNGGQSSKSSQGGYSENIAQFQAGLTNGVRVQAVQEGYSGNNNAQSQAGRTNAVRVQANQGGYSGNNNAQSQSVRTNAVRVQAVQGGYSVDSNQAQSSHIKDFQVNNLVLDKSGVLQTYDTNKAAKVIIHAQNVIIKSDIPVEKASVAGQRDITPLLQQQLRTLLASQVKDSSITAKTNAFIPTPNYFKPSANPQPLVILNNNNKGGQSGSYNAPNQGGGYNLASSIIQATAFTNNNNNVALLPQDYGAGLQPPLPYAPSVKAPSPSSPPNDYGAGLQPPLPYAPPPVILGAASNSLQNLHFVLPAQTTIPFPLPQGPVGIVVGQFQGPTPTPNNNKRPPMDYHTGLYAPPPFSHNKNNNNNNNNNNRGRGNRIPEGKIAGDPVKILGSQNSVKVIAPNVDINIKAKGNNSPPRFKSSDKPGADYGSSVAYFGSDAGKLQESSTEKSIVQSESVVKENKQFPFKLSPENPGKALPTYFGTNVHPFAYLATSTKRPLVDQSSSKFRYKPAKRPSLFSISFGNPSQLESTPAGPVYVGPTLRVPRPGPGRLGNKTRNGKTVYKGRSKPQPPQFSTELDDSFFEASVDNKVKSKPNKPNISHDDFESSFKYFRGRGIPRRPTSSDSSEQSSSGYSFEFGDPYTRLGKDLFYGVYDILKKNTPSFQTIASMPKSFMSTMNKIKIPPVQLQFYRVR